MPAPLRTLAWIACVLYSTIPGFWLMIHPRAEFWRARPTSPYKRLLPIWIGMWIAVAAMTAPWNRVTLYEKNWTLIPAAALSCAGLILYRISRTHFSLAQLGGLPEILRNHSQQNLVTTGIRAHIRHPIYLAHLCEMLAWSIASALAVCWILTALAILTGIFMIRMEDDELEKRFGEPYSAYRRKIPALIPKMKSN